MTWIEPDVDGFDVEVRRVQPYQATKAYLCPGCNRDIPAGTGHLVAVPGGGARPPPALAQGLLGGPPEPAPPGMTVTPHP